MLLEMWVTDQNGNVIDLTRTVQNLYMMAAQSPPTVCSWDLLQSALHAWVLMQPLCPCVLYQVTLVGSTAVFSPGIQASASSTTFTSTYVDLSSVADQKPWQRFTLPIGQAFNYNNQQSQQWYLTLANLASQASWDMQQQYAIKATCMVSDQVGFSFLGHCKDAHHRATSMVSDQWVVSGQLVFGLFSLRKDAHRRSALTADTPSSFCTVAMPETFSEPRAM